MLSDFQMMWDEHLGKIITVKKGAISKLRMQNQNFHCVQSKILGKTVLETEDRPDVEDWSYLDWKYGMGVSNSLRTEEGRYIMVLRREKEEELTDIEGLLQNS